MLEAFIFLTYFLILTLVAFFSYKKQRSDADFVLGNRSLNFWLTALSAHASDMSSWLFLGYPAMIFVNGLFGAWAAIGLSVFMFLNWQFVAPKLRTSTGKSNNLTLNAYFESRFNDTTGSLRIISAFMSVLFFTFYITSGLVGLGHLLESLFHFPYVVGILVGLFIIVTYVFLGGYKTIAWIDLFQGFFLLGVILAIPLILYFRVGSMKPFLQALHAQHLTTSLFPDFGPKTIFRAFLEAASWGLGYFGVPHILTKFMGIRDVKDMAKAKWLGISWQITALSAATFIGIMGVYFFPQGLSDPEDLVIQIVQTILPAFFAGLVLCAILAATTNVMAAQILVVASNFSEDFYKRIFRRNATSKELLWVSRASVLLISLIGFIIAYFEISSIYGLVQYSWSGLGSSFGPLVLYSLYRKSVNRYGAFAGVLVGGVTSALWPYFNDLYQLNLPSLVVGFVLSCFSIELVSRITRHDNSSHSHH